MYEYVIVGAGSAGCVLANRLSEDPDVNVLLVEAGGPDTNPLIHMPVAWTALFRSNQDWDHSSVYEPHCNNRRIFLPRGKVLGGSSSTNAMVYIRGNPLDYDEWRDLGCPGWGWNEMLPYFKRAEDNERGHSEFHGVGGPLPVSDVRSRNAIAQAFIDAAIACGLPPNDDFNGATQDGVGWYQLTQRNGVRASAAAAYLRPAMSRPNPARRDACPGRESAVRRHAGGWRSGCAAWRADRIPCLKRGHRQLRLLQLTAAADAVGHWSGEGTRGAPDCAGG